MSAPLSHLLSPLVTLDTSNIQRLSVLIFILNFKRRHFLSKIVPEFYQSSRKLGAYFLDCLNKNFRPFDDFETSVGTNALRKCCRFFINPTVSVK